MCWGRGVRYDWEGYIWVGSVYQPIPNPPGPKWLRDLLGEDFFFEVKDMLLWPGHRYTNVDLRRLYEFRKLTRLNHIGSEITDEAVKEFRPSITNCPIVHRILTARRLNDITTP